MREHRLCQFFILFFSFLFILTGKIYSHPLDTIVVDRETHSLKLGTQLLFFEDTANVFGADPSNFPSFKKNFKNTYQPGYYSNGNIWLTFYLKNLSPTRDFILEVGGYNEVQVFYKTIFEIEYNRKITGRYIPYPENEMGDFHFRINKVKIPLDSGVVYEFKVFYPDPKIDAIKPDVTISSYEQWYLDRVEKDADKNVFLGLFFGVALVLALINFIFFFIHHEKSYKNYSLYILTIVYFEASRYGIVDHTLLIEYPRLYFVLENTFLLLTIVYYLLFLKTFLSARERYPFWNKVVGVLIPLQFVGLAITLSLILFPEVPLTAIKIRNYFLLLTIPVALVFFVTLIIKGNKTDKIFLLGSVVLVVAGFISLSLDLFFKEHKNPDLVFQIGVIIELTIFSIGLGVKSRISEKEKQAAQLGLIAQLKENERLQKSINQELERQVEERTNEIKSQNEELIQQQEELAAHRDILEVQNKSIEEHVKELQLIRSKLELKVESRTQDLKRANHELLQRNNQLEQYAYITAHNLRAPVARLKGLMYIFSKMGAKNQQNQELVEKIVQSAGEMDEVLTDMNKILELKNSSLGRTNQVNLEEVLRKVRKILKDNLQEANGRIITKLEEKNLNVIEPYLESILYNLIHNSIKYRSDKQSLEILIHCKSEDKNYCLSISDNGIGIDLDQHYPKLFGLYQRFHDHVQGKGIGLYLVKTQVEAMGGTIKVESQQDVGTTFTIIFPK